MNTKGLAIPTVHLNGTSADGLLEQLCDACNAIRDAEAALREAAPHGRDYYLQEPALNQFQVAQTQHFARLVKLAEVRAELEQIAEAVDEQKEQRERQKQKPFVPSDRCPRHPSEVISNGMFDTPCRLCEAKQEGLL